MQWNRVKTLLIIMLIVVNSFLGIQFLMQQWNAKELAEQRLTDMKNVLAEKSVTCSDSFSLPDSRAMVTLEIDRDRAREDMAATALLSSDVERIEDADGTVNYTSKQGSMIWRMEGSIAVQLLEKNTGAMAKDLLLSRATLLLNRCGFDLDGVTLAADEKTQTVTATGAVSKIAVFNRTLTLSFDKTVTSMEGFWFFGDPYMLSSDQARTYNATDALLQLVRDRTEVRQINSISLGYLIQSTGGRLQLAPTWRVSTNQGVIFVDALQKTVVE